MNGSNSLTEGVIWKKMLMFALPVFLGNVFQQFYNAIDSWCVGNFLGLSHHLDLQLHRLPGLLLHGGLDARF